MHSVADQLRAEQLQDMQKLTPDERVRIALELGARDLEFYMAANHVDRDTAIAALRRSARAGRIPSKCADEP
jgi:hypothetical protein